MSSNGVGHLSKEYKPVGYRRVFYAAVTAPAANKRNRFHQGRRHWACAGDNWDGPVGYPENSVRPRRQSTPARNGPRSVTAARCWNLALRTGLLDPATRVCPASSTKLRNGGCSRPIGGHSPQPVINDERHRQALRSKLVLPDGRRTASKCKSKVPTQGFDAGNDHEWNSSCRQHLPGVYEV